MSEKFRYRKAVQCECNVWHLTDDPHSFCNHGKCEMVDCGQCEADNDRRFYVLDVERSKTSDHMTFWLRHGGYTDDIHGAGLWSKNEIEADDRIDGEMGKAVSRLDVFALKPRLVIPSLAGLSGVWT